MLSETPPVWKGSSKLFRNLKEKGKFTLVVIHFEMDIILFILFIYIFLIFKIVLVTYVCLCVCA